MSMPMGKYSRNARLPRLNGLPAGEPPGKLGKFGGSGIMGDGGGIDGGERTGGGDLGGVDIGGGE